MIDLHHLNRHRQVELELTIYGSIGNSREGVFAFHSPEDSKVILRAVASSDGGWEHVSVSPNKRRCPTWEEMDFIKRRFFRPTEVVMQLHPAESDHLSLHDYCLHLWRPTEAVIPLPPKEFVA